VLSNVGQEAKAADLLRGYFDNRNYDYELVQAGYAVGLKMHDQALAIRALEVRNQTWPEQAADGYFRMGTIYAEATPPSSALALNAFSAGLAAVPAAEKDNFLQQVPAHYRAQLQK
jgi:O-antigen ligase